MTEDTRQFSKEEVFASRNGLTVLVRKNTTNM